MKSILDNSFRYTPSSQTDVSKTFARLRHEQKHQADLARVQAMIAHARIAPDSSARQPGSQERTE